MDLCAQFSHSRRSVPGLEQKASFVIAGGCDMIHARPEYDLDITGCMKLAHLCEALGLDVQLHASGPAHRHCIAALRDPHFYELALVGPDMPNAMPPIYTCGYSDLLEEIGADGCFPVPTDPGLGVSYDWGADRAEPHRASRVRVNLGPAATPLRHRHGLSGASMLSSAL